MAYRPNPSTYICPSCGWKTTTAPRSDALIRGLVVIPDDIYFECPQCGHKPLSGRPASWLERTLMAISRLRKH